MGGYFPVLRYMLGHLTFMANWPEPWRSLAGYPHRLYLKFDALLGGPLFYALDQLDTSQKLTIGYFLHATKLGVETGALPDDAYWCPVVRQVRRTLRSPFRNSEPHTRYAVSAHRRHDRQRLVARNRLLL